ncbi:hypothetical protein EX219_09915 [Bacillus aerophilus]|nr:hypothetical protein [Bacillus aerophilus]MBX7013576.1 hypothetical protein [Bacillus aerophilus]
MTVVPSWAPYAIVYDVKTKLKENNKSKKSNTEDVIREGLTQFNEIQTEFSLKPPRWVRDRLKPPPIPDLVKLVEDQFKELQRLAKETFKTSVTDAIKELRNQVPDPTKEARQQMLKKIEEIQEELEKILDSLNPWNVLNEALSKAELLCEEYLNGKIESIVQPMGFKGVSDVTLKIEGSTIEFFLDLYFAQEGDAKTNYLLKLSFSLSHDITQLNNIPEFPEPIIENRADEEIRNQIESKRQEILEGFLSTLFGDYLLVIQKFKELLGI